MKLLVGLGALALVLIGAQQALAVAPSASLAISPTTAQIGQTVNFSGSASSDSDGSILNYEWDLNGDGSFETDTDGTATASRSYGAPATLTIKMRVTDDAGVTDVDAKTLIVVNRPPVAAITANPARAQIGQSVEFSGSGSSDPDPGDSIQSYEWDLGTGSFAAGSAAATASTSFPAGGDKQIRLRVTDEFGGTNVATLVFHVNAKPVAKPLCAAVNAEPGQNPLVPIVGQQVGCTSRSTDAEATNANKDNTIVKFEWFDANPVPPMGPFGGNNASVVHAAYTTAGVKRVVLQVTDDEGAVSEALPESIATIDVNTRPTADFSYSPPTPVKTDEITFSQAASDPDMGSNGALTFQWDFGNDGSFDATGASVKKTLPTGDHQVRLRVQDGGGARKELTKTVQVAETRPTAAFGFAPNFPLPGQAVAFASTSAPSAGQQIAKQQWDFDYDPVSQKFDVDAEGTNPSHAYSTPGVKTVALKVTEAGGGFDVEIHTVVVNAPPQASFSAAPSVPVTDDKVTFSSTSADADGPISQAWDTDNDGQFDDAAGAVATRSFAQPGTYTVRLRVADDRGAGTVSVGTVKVAQRPAQGVLSGRLTALDFTARIAGRTTKRGAKITLFRVRAPKGTLVRLKCKGEDCPMRSKRVKMKRDRLRFEQLERNLRAGTKIIIDATLDGFIGRRVVFTIREGKSPKRRDLCIQPGAKRARPCAGS